MADEEIKLILDVKGVGAIEDLQQNLEYTRASLSQLKAAYNAGEVTIDQYLKTGARLARQEQDLVDTLEAVAQAEREAAAATNQATAAAQQATIAAGKQAAAQEKVGESAKKGGANVGQAALDASRALEDLQYGIAGVVNNIPSLVMSLGGSAGLTAVISLGAIAVAQLVKNWGGLTSAFQETTQIPKATDDLDGLQSALTKAKDRMEELGKKTSVTLSELAEYNTLRSKTAAIEKSIADEQERQKRAKEFKDLKDPAKTEEEKARADILKPQFGDPGQEQLAKAVERAAPRGTKDKLQEAYRKALKEAGDNIAEDPFNLVGVQGTLNANAEKLRVQLEAEEARIVKAARQTTIDAVIGGDKGAFARIQAMMAQNPGAFTDQQRDAFAQATPEAIREKARAPMRVDDQRRMAKLDEDLKKKAEKDENDRIDRLNAQGKEGEAEALKENRALAKGKTDAQKEQEKALADQVKTAKAATDAKEKALRATSLDEEAAAEAARLRTTGMSPEQQQEMLRRGIGQRVGAAFPGMGAMEQGALTNRFAQGANQQVGDQMAGLMGNGMNQQQAAIEVAAETQAIVAQLLAKQRGIGNAIGQLRQNNQNLRRQVEMPGNWNGNPMGGD